MQSVHTLLKLAKQRWTGHVTRMPAERLPKKAFRKERALNVAKRNATKTHLHHQSQYSPSSLALFATDSIELKLT